jgi:hypothetical protein
MDFLSTKKKKSMCCLKSHYVLYNDVLLFLVSSVPWFTKGNKRLI